MRRFVKYFKANSIGKIEAEINELARKRNLDIISVTTCCRETLIITTVVFEKNQTLQEEPK